MTSVKARKSVPNRGGALCGPSLLLRAQLGRNVTYNFMPGTNFGQFHAFKWVNIPGGIDSNQMINQEIQNAVGEAIDREGAHPD
jgi:hypothetical protein